MLYHQLSKYSINDIKSSLLSIPSKNLLWACLASIGGYVALSSYDYLALRYIKKKLAAWKWIFAGFIGFSVSNNAGHAIVSGGTIRYRLYTRWRFRGIDIVKMVTFSGFTYLIACFFLIIVGYVMTPEHAFGDASSTRFSTFITMIFSLVGLIIYFWASLYYKKHVTIKGVKFKMPKFNLAVRQMIIGSIDIVMASLVLYSVLICFVKIDGYWSYLKMYYTGK